MADIVANSPHVSAVAGSAWWSPAARLVLALAWVLMCILVGCYAVLRASRPELQRGDLGLFSPGWGLTQVVLLAGAAALAWRLPGDARQERAVSAMVLAACVAILGLLAVGLRGIEWTRWRGPQVVALADTRTASSRETSTPAQGNASARQSGDAVAGGRAFAQTCAACHGPTGQGISGVAPAVLGVPFVLDSSEGVLMNFVINGRPAEAPDSKMRKLMPPRGGNPFLSDADVLNIVAYLRGGNRGVAGAGGAVEAPILPRWVVPAPPRGPGGLARSVIARGSTTPLPDLPFLATPTLSEFAFIPMAALLSGYQMLLTLVAVGLSVCVVWRTCWGFGSPGQILLSHTTRWCWAGLALSAAVFFALLYLV